MTAPTSREEYERRFHENTRIEGYGLDVATVSPCPFCAAPDWLRCRIVDTEAAIAKGAVCSECGRGARGVVTKDEHSTTISFVQTCGDNPPPWAPPMPREGGP